MGKHKDKKSKKHKKEKKHKKDKKHHESSGDSSADEKEILWCDGSEPKGKKDKVDKKDKKEESAKKVLESSKKPEEKPEAETVSRENVDDWLGFFGRTTSGNAKQGNIDRQKRKDDLAKADNKLRYARELNSYYKDEERGQYIENPDEFYKNNSKSQAQEYSDSGSNSDSDSDRDDDRGQSDHDEKEQKPLTPAEKNALNAKLLKAEMLGDEELVRELKSQLERSTGSGSKKKEVEVYQRKVTKQEKEASEDSLSVREMYYQMKSSTSSRDEVMRFISSSSKFKRPDDEYEEVKAKKKKQKTDKEVYEKRRDVQDSKCRQCIEETDRRLLPRFEPELESCFVALSDKETFVPNVIQIRSRDHSMKCSLDGDEDCWREIRLAMRKIAAFFDQVHGQMVVFMETHFRAEKAFQNLSKRHFVIEAIPLKRKYEDDARIYFHKAIMECEEEWSTNRKLIKLEERPVTAKIPKGLPYFWVSFGPNFNGFGHIIDDERRFPHNFGTEIISGLLDIDCSKWNKHKRYESNSSSGRFISDWKQFLSSSK